MPIECRKCHNDHAYEALVMRGEVVGVIGSEDDRTTCPVCGSAEFERQVGVVQLPGINEYPYFNRGLDAMVASKQHYDRLCKEKGLVPIGDQEEALLSNQQRERDRVIRERKEREEAQRRTPGYQEYERWTKGRECAGEMAEIKKAIRTGGL